MNSLFLNNIHVKWILVIAPNWIFYSSRTILDVFSTRAPLQKVCPESFRFLPSGTRKLHGRWYFTFILFIWHRLSHPHVCRPPPVARFVVDVPPAAGTAFLRDLNAGQEAVRAGTTQYMRQQRLYHKWIDFCYNLSVSPDLQDPSLPCNKILQVYGRQVWHTQYSKHCLDQLGKDSSF